MPEGVVVPRRRQRQWRGRSKAGCVLCKTRRIKCDEGRPECKNCLGKDKSCVYLIQLPSTSEVPKALSNQWETLTEGETFHRFVKIVAPILGRFYNLDFWTMMVPQAAKSQEQILNATLAVTTLYDIPISGNAAISANMSKRYQTAINWYCRSVKEVRRGDPQGQKDIRSLLISSILYLFAELRHMDWQNLERLILSAFAIVYSSRSTLWNCRDEILQTCLSMLIDLSVSTSIDSSRIPRAHRQCAIILALKSSTDFKANELHQLKLEVISIMFDFNDLVSVDGFGEENLENDMNMNQRLLKWHQSFTKFDATPGLDNSTRMALGRLEVLHLTLLVRYEDYRTKQPDRQKIEASLDRLLYLYTRGTQFFSRIDTPSMIDAIHVNFVAGCILIPWYWRHPAVIARIRVIFNTFTGYSPDLVRKSLEYMEILINTSRTKSTQLELELFGTKPLRAILYWQQQRCANRLALLSRERRNLA